MTTEKSTTLELPKREQRHFIPEDFEASSWEIIQPYYELLKARSIQSVEDLQKWLQDWSELETAISEHGRWIYVKSTLDTTDEVAQKQLIDMYVQIHPKLTVEENLLQKKLVECSFTDALDQATFFTTIRKIKNSLSLFREENIPLHSEIQLKQSQYDQIIGAQSISYKGTEITIQQAQAYLKSNDRAQREAVYKLIAERKEKDADQLDVLLSELITLRHKIALNAGFDNYILYRFAELNRFDYTPADCLKFHQSSLEVVMPLVHELYENRKKEFGYTEFKPWDKEADSSGKSPLRPFENAEELIDKTIACFYRLHPYFGERIEIMREMNYLDLDSRMGKGPGGYNMTMPEIGAPFIFMNSANSEGDVVTMVHEGGHAIHTFLSHPLALYPLKETTSEIAEVASMAMELMSSEYWEIFYPKQEDLTRARKNHLHNILTVLSKTSMGDSFQFWLYENPTHTVAQRRAQWLSLQQQYTTSVVDWSGYEFTASTGYQSILHFFVVPFYYIEYAFAQLGALAIWKNFKRDKDKAITEYQNALRLGYTKTIPEFYKTAGAKFDFSKTYIAELVAFLKQELAKLN